MSDALKDVYEPLERYRDEFREKFARLTREKFRSLTEASGIDVEANRKQVALVRRHESDLGGARGKRVFFGLLTALGLLGGFGAPVAAFCVEDLEDGVKTGCILGGVAGIALGVFAWPRFGKAGRLIRELEEKIAAAKAIAWEQMDALNRLYTWDITVRLIEETVPRLEFDPYFTARRLADLKRVYAWDDSFNAGKSIVFAQSGVINGNPFILGEYLEQQWGEKTYEGHLDIRWRERVKDANGRTRTVTRHERLTATVTKPIPVYSKTKLLIYGNDAAPNLAFSRQPSGFDDDDLFDGIRKKWKLRQLKKFSRNLDDDSQFTLMGNHEFETWFDARDRDNEVEFRLLFTALAQTQLMALMKDLKTGYGDDFAFIKRRKLNYLYPRHLADAPIDTPPERFRDWDYDHAAHVFIEFNEKYFRDVYFALAPLLAIPLYQQTRTHEDVWKNALGTDGAAFWEHEALANYYGDAKFKHSACITENVLKTSVRSRRDGVSDVEVTAHGFRGEPRVDRKEVYGGDGRYHTVPVEWTEYLPVSRTSLMRVSEAETPAGDFASAYGASAAAVFRRSIRSYLGVTG